MAGDDSHSFLSSDASLDELGDESAANEVDRVCSMNPSVATSGFFFADNSRPISCVFQLKAASNLFLLLG